MSTEQTTEANTETTETTETTTEPEAQDIAPDAVEAEQTADVLEQDDTEPDESTKSGREAAKLRKRAQAAETERDALSERLNVLQRGEVERMATGPGLLADGADLWSAVDLDALHDEHGHIDAARVTQAVTDLLSAKPHYQHRRFTGGADGGARESAPITPPDAWTKAGDVLRGNAG